MNIYEIDSRIEELCNTMVDEETGEMNEEAAAELAQLAMDRNTKIENIACYAKNAKAMAAQMKEEAKKLNERARVLNNKAENASEFLDMILDGQKFESVRAKVSYHKSTAVVTYPGFVEWAAANGHDDLLLYTDPTPSKLKIKEWLKNNSSDYAELRERSTVVIK